MNLPAQRSAKSQSIAQHVIDCVILLEHVGMRQHGTGDVVQRQRVEVGHSVQSREVVGHSPLGAAYNIGFRQIQEILRVIQHLSTNRKCTMLSRYNNSENIDLLSIIIKRTENFEKLIGI